MALWMCSLYLCRVMWTILFCLSSLWRCSVSGAHICDFYYRLRDVERAIKWNIFLAFYLLTFICWLAGGYGLPPPRHRLALLLYFQIVYTKWLQKKKEFKEKYAFETERQRFFSAFSYSIIRRCVLLISLFSTSIFQILIVYSTHTHTLKAHYCADKTNYIVHV